MESNSQMIQVLKGLFVVCRASEKGYLAAADAIPSTTSRRNLSRLCRSAQRFC